MGGGGGGEKTGPAFVTGSDWDHITTSTSGAAVALVAVLVLQRGEKGGGEEKHFEESALQSGPGGKGQAFGFAVPDPLFSP